MRGRMSVARRRHSVWACSGSVAVIWLASSWCLGDAPSIRATLLMTTIAINGFEKQVTAIPEVIECMTVLGDWDYVLTVVARNIEDYQRILLDRIAKLPGLANYKSTLIVRDVKRSTELPV